MTNTIFHCFSFSDIGNTITIFFISFDSTTTPNSSIIFSAIKNQQMTEVVNIITIFLLLCFIFGIIAWIISPRLSTFGNKKTRTSAKIKRIIGVVLYCTSLTCFVVSINAFGYLFTSSMI